MTFCALSKAKGMDMTMKNGSYDASYFGQDRLNWEISRLRQGVNNDVENMNKCLSHLGFSGDKSLLDMGCGPGGTSVIIGKFNPYGQVIGMDREIRFVESAKEYAKEEKTDNVQFVVGDCLEVPFEDNQFDYCFSRFVFQHLSNVDVALNEMIRVARPRAKIGIYEWDEGLTCYNPEPKLYKKYVAAEIVRRRISNGDIYLGRKLYSIFHKAGLKDLEVYQIYSDIMSPGREILLTGQLWNDEPNEQHPYVRMGVMTVEEIKEFYRQMKEIIEMPDSYVSFGSFFVVGRIDK